MFEKVDRAFYLRYAYYLSLFIQCQICDLEIY